MYRCVNLICQNVIWAPRTSFKELLMIQVLQFRHFSSSTAVPVPSMGESIKDGRVITINKSPPPKCNLLTRVEKGDYVEADEIICLIETDKVTVDMRTPHAGLILDFLANEGDTVTVLALTSSFTR
jgi:biotin carboxyl carrier protein